MTRRKKLYISTFVFLIFILLSYLLFKYGIVLRSVPSSSESIDESKKLGVFIAEYKPLTRFFRINNSINISFDEIWIEYQWLYNTNEKPTVFYDRKDNAEILFKTNLDDGFYKFGKVWVIYSFKPLTYYSSEKYPIIHTDIQQHDIKDTLSFQIMLLTPKGMLNEKIGTLNIVRVK